MTEKILSGTPPRPEILAVRYEMALRSIIAIERTKTGISQARLIAEAALQPPLHPSLPILEN